MKLILVRHAQASLGLENYDELSYIGMSQAELLGEYLYKHKSNKNVIISGTLKRHVQTLQPLIEHFAIQNNEDFENLILMETKDLNEFSEDLWKRIVFELNKTDSNFATYYSHFLKSKEKDFKFKKQFFYKMMEMVIKKWIEDDSYGDDNYQIFRARIVNTIKSIIELSSKDKTIYIFSSAGPISIILNYLLNCPNDSDLDWMYSLYNTSISIFYKNKDRFIPIEINTIPHVPYDELKTGI
jgi:broad specificity phosphatase PhoE